MMTNMDEGKTDGTERQVMQDYLDTLIKRGDYPAFFTEDVVVTFEGTDQRAEGREAAGQLIRYVHEVAFDAQPELKSLRIYFPMSLLVEQLTS
jgi:hypothetical protein